MARKAVIGFLLTESPSFAKRSSLPTLLYEFEDFSNVCRPRGVRAAEVQRHEPLGLHETTLEYVSTKKVRDCQ